MADETIVTELIVDSRAAVKGTLEYEVAMRAAQRAFDATTASLNKTKASQEAATAAGVDATNKLAETSRSLQAATKAADVYLGRLDPVIFAQNALTKELNTAQAALKAVDTQYVAGNKSKEIAAQQTLLLTNRVAELNTAITQVGARTLTTADAMNVLNTAWERSEKAAKLSSNALSDYAARAADVVAANQKMANSQLAYNQRAGEGLVGVARSSAAQPISNPLYGAVYDQRQNDLQAAFGKGIDDIRASLIPAVALQQQYEAQLRKINEAVAVGAITQKEAVVATNLATKAYQGHDEILTRTGASTGQLRFATQQLGVQFTQMVSGVAAGQPVFTVLIQQGHQIIDVMLATNTSFKDLVGQIGTLVAAIPAWVYGVAAAAAAIVGLGIAAENNALRMERLRNEISLVTDDYAALSIQADAAARSLATTTNLGIGDARSAANTVATTPGFAGSSAQIQTIVKAFNDLSIAQQKATIDTAELGRALRDPVAFLREMEPTLKTVNSALVRHAELLAASGDKAGAFALALKAVQDATKNVARDITPLEQALQHLHQAWAGGQQGAQGFIQAVGTAFDNIAGRIINGVATIIDALTKAGHWIDQHFPNLPGSQFVPPSSSSYGGANPVPQTGTIAALGQAAVTDYLKRNTSYNDAAIAGILTSIGAESSFSVNKWNDARTSYGLFQWDKSGGRYQQLARDTGQAEPGLIAQLDFFLKEVGPDGAFWQVGKALESVSNTAAGAIETTKFLTTDFLIPKDAAQRALTRAEHAPAFFSALQKPALSKVDISAGAIGDPEGGPIPGTGLANTAKNLEDIADALSKGSPAEKARMLAAELSDITKALRLDPENKAWLQAQQQLTLDLYNALPALDAQVRGIELDIAGQNRLSKAWKEGATAASDQQIQNKALVEGLKIADPAQKEYAQAVALLTVEFTKAEAAAERAKIAEADSVTRDQINLVQAQTATIGLNNDARELLITHMKNEQDVARQYPQVSDAERAARVKNLDTLAAMNQALQNQQNSVNALAQTFSQAFDTIGNAITQALVSGQGAAVNWRNVMVAVAEQVLQAFLKLAILNPLLNSLLPGSTTLPTLGNAIQGLSGGGGSSGGLGSLASTGGSLVSGGSSALQAFGFQGLGGQINGFFGGPGTSLFAGIGGPGGIGGSLSTFLNTGTGIGQSAAGTQAIEALGLNAGSGLGGASIGSMLGGVGGGFALGSLGGGLLQGALNKTGPAPMIGAGVGAIAGALIGSFLGPGGALVGGLLGGLLGGGTGGVIGPQRASPFSSTGISLVDGRLSVGGTVAQGDDPTQERADALANVASLNAYLDGVGLKLTTLGKLSQIGQNTPGGFQDPSKFGSLGEAFSGFGFSATDPVLNQYLSGRSFADTTALQTAVTGYLTLVNTTIPALTAEGQVTGTLNDAITQITNTFGAAIQTAQEYGVATDTLTAAQGRAIQKQIDAASVQTRQADEQLNIRINAARGTDPLGSALYAFDISATQQRQQFSDSFVAIWGDSIKTTQAYMDQMALLETALGAERFAIQKQFSDQALALQQQTDAQALALQQQTDAQALALQQQTDAQALAAKNQAAQNAAATITSLLAYVTGLQTSSESPLSPQDQLTLARNQFNAVAGAAAAGDYGSLQQLQSYAQTFLGTSRAVYGSGASYVDDFQRVLDAVRAAASVPADTLTASVLQVETRTQTAELVDQLDKLRAAVDRITTQLSQNSSAPDRIAA